MLPRSRAATVRQLAPAAVGFPSLSPGAVSVYQQLPTPQLATELCRVYHRHALCFRPAVLDSARPSSARLSARLASARPGPARRSQLGSQLGSRLGPVRLSARLGSQLGSARPGPARLD